MTEYFECRYETMILLRSDLDAEKRDVELAKFEAFLKKEGAVKIDALVRANSQALAYPIKVQASCICWQHNIVQKASAAD